MADNNCIYFIQQEDQSWLPGEHFFENGICFNCGKKEEQVIVKEETKNAGS